MMELLATVLGVGFVALVMLSMCRAAARADATVSYTHLDVYKRQRTGRQ